MDSQETKTENFELPSPAGGASSEAGVSQPEQNPAAQEQQGAPGASDPGAAQVSAASPMADPAALIGIQVASNGVATTHTSGLTAEDADLIEKTWVEKAKQIVSETRGDPYSQNKEINKVKADYIKKRYNKDIKLASE